MYRRTLILVLSLIMLVVCSPASEAEASQIVEKEDYTRIETTKAIYFVDQILVNCYGQETFQKLFNLVDERFEKIVNITGWSSERFYENKLEVTIDKLNDVGGSGGGGYGHATIRLGTDFYQKMNPNTIEGFPSWAINAFLHEMTQAIIPSTILNRGWFREGLAGYLSFEVQVLFGDRTRNEVDEWYSKSWTEYVNNNYVDFHHNKTIQDDQGSFITAWMLNNITQTYGWKTHECFFRSIPDEYLFYLPDFSLPVEEATSYYYHLDSLFVGYYSLAAEASLYSTFRSWGVKTLPNPMTIIELNGTRTQNQTYASRVLVSLFGFGDNVVNKIEYSFDQKVWNVYCQSFSLSDYAFLYYRSTDSKGNIGPTSSITLNFETDDSDSTEHLPTSVMFAIIASVGTALAVFGLLVYLKKRRRSESANETASATTCLK